MEPCVSGTVVRSCGVRSDDGFRLGLVSRRSGGDRFTSHEELWRENDEAHDWNTGCCLDERPVGCC